MDVNTADLVVRKVQVLSGLRALGQCLVRLASFDTGHVVFSQVRRYLAGFCQVPPLPRWIYVGDSFETGEHIDVEDCFAQLVEENEIATIRCLEPNFGNTDVPIAEALEAEKFKSSTAALCLQVMRSHGLLATGDLNRLPQREIFVKSNLRGLGSCVVTVPPGSTPYTVFSWHFWAKHTRFHLYLDGLM